jgi:hypothetical protein
VIVDSNVTVAQCGIRENLAEYYGQKSASARLDGVGREAQYAPIFFTQARNRGLNDSLSTTPPWRVVQDWTVKMTGVDVMMRISNTKVSRTAAEGEEYDRINALLDQALELTFPCSDPVAITINGYDVYRPKAATDFEGKRTPVTRSKGWRGRA